MSVRGPHYVSFVFRYAIYLPIMGELYDKPAGFNPHSPLPGRYCFSYFGA